MAETATAIRSLVIDESASPLPVRFTLRPKIWYATEFIGDEFEGELLSYSAIRVDQVIALTTGKRRFQLHFFHANYPEGVRDKVLVLETIERGQSFMLARSLEHNPTRLLLIYEMSWEWLRTHLSVVRPEDDVNVQQWLSRNA